MEQLHTATNKIYNIFKQFTQNFNAFTNPSTYLNILH